MRVSATALLALLAGCNATLVGGDGGPLAGDGGARVDGGLAMDAGSRDAGPSPLDGGALDGGALDGGVLDGGMSAIDSGFVACSVSGVPGTCEPTSGCTGDRAPTPGFCPGPADIQCCTRRVDGGDRDGGPACDPDDMPTPNEGLVEPAGDPGCPRGMVDLGSVCIDRYEASLVIVDDAGPIGSWSPYHPPDGVRVAAVSLEGAVPQGYISGRHAEDACEEAGKRLCTNEEWLFACRGAEARVYPYGDTRLPGVCNDARAVHPAVERFGTSADWIWSALGDACINQIPDSLATTGSHPGCVTPEGVFDLMGNLHEWTADAAGTFRGGFYADTYRNGEGCLYRTTAHDVGHWDYSTGFRCCADPS